MPLAAARTRESAAGLSNCLDTADRTERAALAARVAVLERQVGELQMLLCPAPAAASREQRLLASARDMGCQVSGDYFVREADAARLIGRAQATLRGWRHTDQRLPFRMLGRAEYAISDLADYLASADG